MDINEFKASLKKGTAGGVYIFAGEEEYLIRYYLASLRDSVAPESAFAVFNNPVFDGEDIDFAALEDAIKAPPMMSDKKLVEWRHADLAALRDKELELFNALIELVQEHPYTVLAFTAVGDCFDFGTSRKTSRFISKFGSRVNVLRFDKSSENQLYSWLKKHFDSEGIEVNLAALKELVFRSGRSMEILGHEVEKLAALAKSRGKTNITSDDVIEVASTTPESDTFALSNAITDRSRPRAYLALEELKHKRTDPTVVMGMIAKTFAELSAVACLLDEGKDSSDISAFLKMNKYKLNLYISAAKRYGSERLSEILEELSRVDSGAKFGGVAGYTAIELFLSKSL